MQIKILNFGPIKHFDGDLSRDITVIYGKNNTGKSYAMSVVYLLLKHLLNLDIMRIGEFINRTVTDETYERIKALSSLGPECDITGEVNEMFSRVIQAAITGNLENSFKNTFGPLNNLKNPKTRHPPIIELNILGAIIQLSIDYKIRVKHFSLGKSVFFRHLPKDTNRRNLKGQDTSYSFYRYYDKDSLFDDFHTCIREMIGSLFERIQDEIEEMYFLPALRSGLYTNLASFISIFTKLSQKRYHMRQKIELPVKSELIVDYVLRLSEIKGNTTKDKIFYDIARYLEKEILKGEIRFDPKKKKLTFSPEHSELVLNITEVSSVVSELSPIAVLIKYILYQRISPSLIFIEEPEAHLHPEAQVKLVEVFVKLVKAGVKLIITSHSNYIFNKLNNLVINKDLEPDSYAPIILKETEKGSISHVMAADDLG